MDKIILLPAQLTGIRTRVDRTLSLTFSTPEISPQKAGQLMGLNQCMTYLAIKPETFRDEEIRALEELKAEDTGGKTPSQRLRAVLFRLWEQDPGGFASFTLFYDHHMERFIENLKNRLT